MPGIHRVSLTSTNPVAGTGSEDRTNTCPPTPDHVAPALRTDSLASAVVRPQSERQLSSPPPSPRANSGDDSSDTAAAPAFTSDATATQNTTDADTTVGASSGAQVSVAADHEDPADGVVAGDGASSTGDTGDERDVASIGTCVGGEDITLDVDGVQPIISGDCGTVNVNGDDVGGAIDNAAEIIVNGDGSRIQNFGLGSLSVTGDDNTVVGGPESGAPVSDTGTGNTIL